MDTGAKANPRQLLIEDFVKAIREGKEPPITGEDGRAALEFILAAYKSGQENRPVTLPLK